MADTKPRAGASASGKPAAPGKQPYVQMYHFGREVKFYSVTEGEYTAGKTFSAQVTVCFAAGSFILALIAPEWLDLILNNFFGIGKTLSPDEWHKMVAKSVGLGLISILFYGMGLWCHWSKKKQWEKAERDSTSD